MAGEETSLNNVTNEKISEKIRPIAARAADLLTVKPVWELYRRFGFRGAIGGLLFVFFILYLAIAIVLAIPWAVIGLIGLASMDSLPLVAATLAVPITAYGGYRAYSLVSARNKLFEYSERPTYDNAAESFEYFDINDDVSRSLATYTVADVMEENPGKLIKKTGKDPEDVALEIVDLLHDDNEKVRANGSHSTVFMSRDFPDTVLQYRDDVFAATKYPNSTIQGNAAIAAGNLAFYEPALRKEVLEHVEPLCDDPDHELRQHVCTALGHVHHERAAELLDGLANDPNPAVRQDAVEAKQMLQQEQRVNVDADPETPY